MNPKAKHLIKSRKPLLLIFLLSFALLQAASASASLRDLFKRKRDPEPNPVYTILVMGDSHLGGPFGDRLYADLYKLPNTAVYLFSSCGTTVKQWYSGKPTRCDYVYKGPHYVPPYRDENGEEVPCSKRDCIEVKKHATPLAKDLLKSINPNLVIIEHGTNYASEKPLSPDDQAYIDQVDVKEMRKLVLDVNATHAACTWVGLPDTRAYRNQQAHLVDLITQATQQDGKALCQFIDSTQITSYPDHATDDSSDGGDRSGVHYWGKKGTVIANAWADQVMRMINFKNQ